MRKPAEERFWSKVEKSGGPDACWLWTAGKTRGYGAFKTETGQMVRAHRWAYQALVGPIPVGLTIDHLCRNHSCVNPAHLEPLSNRENLLRGESMTARQARQTHCKNGHPFDLFNTRWERKGRRCVICEREYRRRRWREGRG